ncbi:YihY/virulence factor BrkB family protein [Gloeocapsopsis crepidinum LEGE 06123]|uniref:YihY/virulence factor BrkB family protein n=1 Tax=Gloeocapsopsis crepidinum LEGE 06123 TaxID=588587 RepID=A0ABR9UPU5_9CHRO|nr:YihY/virulence factor BrkB family protein [Gloeocapsopsis crepidinum]MBE9190307.1 YihY/virulence factor BrkB family protein [Gloeocapsopsis crepidinum LEGE 06123]
MFKTRFVRFFRHMTWATLRTTFVRVAERRLLGLSAEIAYNSMLSLFPAILAVLTAISLFQESLQSTFKQLALRLSTVAPDEALFLIRNFAQEITQNRNGGLFSISFVAAIWIASGALNTIMTALDQIHQIPSQQTRPFWKAKLISIGLTIGSIVLLVVASFLVFLSDLILAFFVRESGLYFLLFIWQILIWPLALGVMSSAFAFIYRYGPSRWDAGTPMMPGAILAAVSWAILSALFRMYVANFGNYNQAYGAVGAVIVLMLWLYMSAAVLLVGDQLNVSVGEAMRSHSKTVIEIGNPNSKVKNS